MWLHLNPPPAITMSSVLHTSLLLKIPDYSSSEAVITLYQHLKTSLSCFEKAMTLWHFQLGRSQGGCAPVQRALFAFRHLLTCSRCQFSPSSALLKTKKNWTPGTNLNRKTHILRGMFQRKGNLFLYSSLKCPLPPFDLVTSLMCQKLWI